MIGLLHSDISFMGRNLGLVPAQSKARICEWTDCLGDSHMIGR